MEKEEEEGTEKSVTEQALRESRAKFVSITLLFKRTPIRTNMTVTTEGNYLRPGEKMDFNKLATEETLFQITLGNCDLGARCFGEIKYQSHSEIHFLPLGLSSMRETRCEGIYSRKLLSEEKRSRRVCHLLPH